MLTLDGHECSKALREGWGKTHPLFCPLFQWGQWSACSCSFCTNTIKNEGSLSSGSTIVQSFLCISLILQLSLLDCKPFEGRGCDFMYFAPRGDKAYLGVQSILGGCHHQMLNVVWNPRPSPVPGPELRPLLKPAASRLPGGGSSCLVVPAHVEPFPVRPPPSGCAVRTWPSPQDSQCASGKTYLLQPTTLGVLASRVASNPSFHPPTPTSLSRLPIISSLIGLSSQASQWLLRLLSQRRVAGERDSDQWLLRTTRDAS